MGIFIFSLEKPGQQSMDNPKAYHVNEICCIAYKKDDQLKLIFNDHLILCISACVFSQAKIIHSDVYKVGK